MPSDGVIGALLIGVGSACAFTPRWVLFLDRLREWSPAEAPIARVLGKRFYIWAVRACGAGALLLGLLWLVMAYHWRQ